MIRAALVWMALAGSVAAQSLPALYDVTGVASDDVLNIRSAPSADAPILATLKPDAKRIEVIAIDGNWALVNTSETSGHVNVAYLARRGGPDWFALEQRITCYGTEPFWAFKVDPGRLVATFSAPDTRFDTTITTLWPGQEYSPTASVAMDEGFATYRAGMCSDGMSDNSFGLIGDVFLTGPDPIHYSGCCLLRP